MRIVVENAEVVDDMMHGEGIERVVVVNKYSSVQVFPRNARSSEFVDPQSIH